jgi:hypothetical protein
VGFHSSSRFLKISQISVQESKRMLHNMFGSYRKINIGNLFLKLPIGSYLSVAGKFTLPA